MKQHLRIILPDKYRKYSVSHMGIIYVAMHFNPEGGPHRISGGKRQAADEDRRARRLEQELDRMRRRVSELEEALEAERERCADLAARYESAEETLRESLERYRLIYE
jgi:predicted RNase H-like nuclease (RuvC/YqgF family)